jgi:signal peptidase I
MVFWEFQNKRESDLTPNTISEELICSAYIKRMQPPNLFYRGSSMKGTFKPGDKLIIETIPLIQVKRGDLIIFRIIGQEREDFIVHRVVDLTPKGLVTRGDNCLEQDKELVAEENIYGRVIKYDRKGKIYRTWNSRLGMMWAGALHGRLQIIRNLKFFLRKPYLMIRESGIVAQLWQPEIEVMHFETPDGPLIKYVHKGRTVAIYWTEENRWQIQRLYDLVIWPRFIS